MKILWTDICAIQINKIINYYLLLIIDWHTIRKWLRYLGFFLRSLKSWNDVTFCTPPEVKFDAFGTSKHGEGKSLSEKKKELLYLSVLWGDLIEQIKKICHMHFKIHYCGLLLRLLRPWGTRLTTPFPLQTSDRLRFRCTATTCSASTCLYKNGYVWLYPTFIWQRLHQWQWFPPLMLILHLPALGFASQLLLEPPVIPTTKQNKLREMLVN